jgi:four helix bundle protein
VQNSNSEFKIEFKKRLYIFVLKILKLVQSIESKTVSRILVDQVVRSATSILANFVEGQASSSRREFVNFMQISLKSANETKVWITLLRDTGTITVEDSVIILKENIEIAKVLASIVISTKGKKII